MVTVDESAILSSTAVSVDEHSQIGFSRFRIMNALKEVQNEKQLSSEALETLQKLIKLHLEQLVIEAQYRRDWLALKLEYHRKLDPYYSKRFEVLQLDSTKGDEIAVPPKAALLSMQAAPIRVPDFWLNAMNHHPAISSTIGTHDEPILRYIQDISYVWENEHEQLSFTISFKFVENPFFKNRELKKSFGLEQDPNTGESILTRSLGTEIEWKPGKDVTTKIVTKRQKNRRTGDTRMVRKTVERMSFFHFFDTHEIPADAALDTMPDQDVRDLEAILELEYEVGCILRDKIISHALGWYLGVEVDEDNASCSSCDTESIHESDDEDDREYNSEFVEDDENEDGTNAESSKVESKVIP